MSASVWPVWPGKGSPEINNRQSRRVGLPMRFLKDCVWIFCVWGKSVTGGEEVRGPVPNFRKLEQSISILTLIAFLYWFYIYEIITTRIKSFYIFKVNMVTWWVFAVFM